jgi:uridine kinase
VTDPPVPVIETFGALAHAVMGRRPRLGTVRLVAVDGPSGAGKTTFAARLAQALSVETAIVPTDAFLDGWAEPLSVWPALRSDVLDPLAAGRPGAYHAYDWTRRRFGAGVIPVVVPAVLILEGVTSASVAVRSELSLAVFVTGDAAERTERTLARDGAEIEAALRNWQAAENMYFQAERTADVADVVVDGTPDLRHDPEKEYVCLRRAGAPTGGWRR